MTKAIIVRPDLTTERVELAGGYQELQQLVGGYIDAIRLYPMRAVMYIHDEAKFDDDHEINMVANSLAETVYPGFVRGDYVAGTVVVVGAEQGNPENIDIEPRLAEIIETGAAQLRAIHGDD